jgi:deoxyhypusine synthase
MKKTYRPIKLDSISTYSINTRNNKVNVDEHFAGVPTEDRTFTEFFDSLPNLLGAESLRGVVSAIVSAKQADRPVVLAMGGHVIKCGLQPVLKKLIDAGVITAVAMNGSAAIHDYEVALVGATSEDVGAALQSGDFGFSEETGKGMNEILAQGHGNGLGFGQSIGEAISCGDYPFKESSLLATCVENKIPVTVHVALGTDIIHQHPQADGAVIGAMSMQDFRLLTAVVADLGDGGVWLYVGSAVLMPEIFLKALSIAQNLGHQVDNFTTANFDMIQHYRPLQNVVKRPTSGEGRGYTITGHHEINIPLLAHAVLDALHQEGQQ